MGQPKMAENRACDRCDRKTHIGRIARARERRNPCKVSHLSQRRNPAILENRDRGAKANVAQVTERPDGKWIVTDDAGKVLIVEDTSAAAWRFVDRREIHDIGLSNGAATRYGRWRVPGGR
jgi:hypothetical protein